VAVPELISIAMHVIIFEMAATPAEHTGATPVWSLERKMKRRGASNGIVNAKVSLGLLVAKSWNPLEI
jgi:hypothetical protein